jgi:nucleoside-diphosphate-sugar epimerase
MQSERTVFSLLEVGMSLSVVVGAGPVGSAVARLLAARGSQVRLISRRGGGPDDPLIDKVALDAADPAALTARTAGAVVLYNCAAPPYHRWPLDWPPLAAGLLTAAEASGAVLASVGNLYLYGAVDGLMTEELPARPVGAKGATRARIWQDALAAHAAGRIRTVEVRASDYLGRGVQTLLTVTVLPKVLDGRRASVPADLDALHSWTYVGDVASTLVAAAEDERAWGRAWHVPTAPALSVREVAGRACAAAGVPRPRLSTMPAPVLWLGGVFDPLARELRETQYQFRRPFVLDSSAATTMFGIEPTLVGEAIAETVGGLARRSGTRAAATPSAP